MDGNEGENREMEELRAQNESLQKRLDEALSEAMVAQCVKEDLVELERQNRALEDEKKTLESLLNETRDEVISVRTRYEHECARLRAVNEQLDMENKEISRLPDSEPANLVDKEALSAFTDATKSLARRVKSNLMPGNASVSFSRLQQHDKSNEESTETSPVYQDPTGIQKAFEDAEALKSIVVPLEEQIAALKDKLRETDAMLRQFEANQVESLFAAEILGRWLAGKKSFAEAMEELEKKELKANSSEDTSPMLLALLNARLFLTVKELNEMRSQKESCVNELDRSVKKCAEFRSQAAEANGRLLRDKHKHHSELAKLASVLSEEQKLALSMQSRSNSTESEVITDTMAADIVISKTDWDSYQAELDKLRALMGLGLDVDVVGSDQFKQLQSQVHEMQAKLSKQNEREEKLKVDIQVMEEQWNSRAEQYQSETGLSQSQVRQISGLISELQTSHRIICEDSKAKLHSLSADRERIVTELKLLQVENEELLGKHKKAQEFQSEMINLPEKMDDMHLLLLTYREQLIAAKIAAEHHEEKRRQIQTELNGQVEELKERLLLLESCQSELEAVQKRFSEMEKAARNLQNDRSHLEKELEASGMQKAKAESQVAELKARISNLQQELDNSVAVQTDFVRLSQSLQMELEKIRQSEKEVNC